MAKDRPLTLQLVLVYYGATILFVILDFAFDFNIRLAFLDNYPGWRVAYYIFCYGCLALMLWRPQWSALIGTAESLLTLSLLIISMGARIMIVNEDMITSGRGMVTMQEVVNFAIASTIAYTAYSRSVREIGR